MLGSYELVLPQDLNRSDLPRVVRPFWAASQLRDAWVDGFSRHKLINAYERLDGVGIGRCDDQALLRTLDEALTSGRLILLADEAVTFDPIAKGRDGRVELSARDGRDPAGFDHALVQAWERRADGGRRQQAAPEPASEDRRPLSFEESVAANNKFFGQPVSKFEPVAKATAPASWFDLQLNDEEGAPIGAALYLVEVDGKVVKRGCLDHQGFARIKGVDASRCTVSFPEFDHSAWQPEAAG